jgi:hypothetical protein
MLSASVTEKENCFQTVRSSHVDKKTDALSGDGLVKEKIDVIRCDMELV